ncbi:MULTISPECIES: hypothetical protein [Microbacterium]|jgi:hypothetical protein|uniref:hypothetical protein n=1 Tax=Microbacterium TaxID=33882 RepID=UPI002783CB49|nr:MULTISPECIES: hypothetical protein [Microbacterium]MDF2918420.1 hypothetical protein [Microbacterium sp.]MDQ1075680.1 hypothetical protein [Microbacterium sp. SORGH_AS_0969]MDQ1115922.1 hypothetical protein [Microbacterium testaceum]
MRTRTLTLLAASVVVLGIATGTATAFAAASDDAISDNTSVDVIAPDTDGADTEIGMPAPLIMTPAELAGAKISLAAGEVLIISTDDDTAGWPGTGGTDNDAVAHFDAASTDADEVSFNAGFTAGETGTTSAWIQDAAGVKTTFEITVEAR